MDAILESERRTLVAVAGPDALSWMILCDVIGDRRGSSCANSSAVELPVEIGYDAASLLKKDGRFDVGSLSDAAILQ
jgi:hypothetical protein